jgi:hypothetical protein
LISTGNSIKIKSSKHKNKRLYSFVSLAQQQEPPKLNLFLIKGTFFKNSND